MNKMLYYEVIVFWMFTTLCFSDDFRNFEGFLMPSIGNLKSDTARAVHETQYWFLESD